MPSDVPSQPLEFIGSYKVLITAGTGVYVGTESFSGGFTCNVPGKTMMITSGSTRNILAHEIGHTLGLHHTGMGCNKEESNKWIMNATIYDTSYNFHSCESDVVKSAVENAFMKHNYAPIREIFAKDRINDKIYDDALFYIHTQEYTKNNFTIDLL